MVEDHDGDVFFVAVGDIKFRDNLCSGFDCIGCMPIVGCNF